MTNRVRVGNSGNLALGVDIGGTKVAVGLVNSRGQIRHAARAPMAARGEAEQGFRAVLNAIDSVMPQARAARVRAIGVCAPGWVESEKGVLLSATNLPCWRNFPLARKIEKHYGLPTRLTNDASAAALAEAKWGAGRQTRKHLLRQFGDWHRHRNGPRRRNLSRTSRRRL